MGIISRTLNNLLWGKDDRSRNIIVKSDPTSETYNYAQPEVVDYDLVRKLYRNRHQQYAFGAQLVKPVVDSNVSFIGIPTIRSLNDETTKILDTLKRTVPFSTVHRIAEREGTCYVWPQWDSEKGMKFVVIPTEQVKQIYIDPITKEVTGYKIVDKFDYPTEETPKHIDIEIFVYKDKIVKTIKGDDPNLTGTKKIRNPFGFIPILRFTNDSEPWEYTGHSEIENIEPQLKLYHDVTLEAMHAQKRDGHPKAKIKTSSPQDWVDRNFGKGTFDSLVAGQASISLKDRDLFVCKSGGLGESDEDIQYIVANRATGDYNTVSEKTFSNIVEGAQTPEIIFGANMGTSLASVREQRPSYIKKIEKKQMQYEEQWRQLYSIALKILGFTSFKEYDDNLTFSWPTPDFSSDKEKADTLNVLSTSLIKMKQAHIMGDKEIHETIKRFDIVQVEQDYDKHYKDVDETANDMAKRIKDETAAKDNEMNQRIATGQYEG